MFDIAALLGLPITMEEGKTLSIVTGAEDSISADWKGLPACCAADEKEGPAPSALGILGMCGTLCGTPCAPPGTCSLQHP